MARGSRQPVEAIAPAARECYSGRVTRSPVLNLVAAVALGVSALLQSTCGVLHCRPESAVVTSSCPMHPPTPQAPPAARPCCLVSHPLAVSSAPDAAAPVTAPVAILPAPLPDRLLPSRCADSRVALFAAARGSPPLQMPMRI